MTEMAMKICLQCQSFDRHNKDIADFSIKNVVWDQVPHVVSSF